MSHTLRILLTVALFATAAACSKDGGSAKGGGRGGPAGPGGKKPPMKFPVQVAPVATQDVEYALTGVGAVEAFERVQVTARVSGVVERVDFAEGLIVKKGQVLAAIEPQRYQLEVNAARAALAKAEAERDEALAALKRREEVNKASPGLIRGEELETFRTRARTAAAEAEARKVAVEQAQLNLRDAYVRAPVAGNIETRTVQTGQYVQPGAVLATLVRRDPLLVRFKVPELDAARLSSGMEVKFTTGAGKAPYTALITHVGQAADPKTRMVEVTGEVNDERRETLTPGAFAQVTVPVSSRKAPVIPQSAVRASEKGFLAFVVDDKDIAHERVVTLGMRTADGLVEVTDGLAPGERLVIRGAEALREGAQVRIADGPGQDMADQARTQGPRGADGGGQKTGTP